MALKPVLKLKVDELFLRWLSEADTQALLKINLKQLENGEPVVSLPQSHIAGANIAAVRAAKMQSPRVRPGSPSTPPCSPALASPRSPRRSVYNNKAYKKSQKHLEINNSQSPVTSHAERHTDSAHSISKRGDPDGQSDNFLRQKEAQLRERREKERKDVISTNSVKNKSDSPNHIASQNGGITSAPNINQSKSTNLITRENENDSLSSSSQHQKQHPAHTPSSKSDSSLLNKHKKHSLHIPQFYFPSGRAAGDGQPGLEATLQQIKEAFSSIEGGKATRQSMAAVSKACGLPSYLKVPLLRYCGGEKHGHVTLQQVLASWKKLCQSCHDNHMKFVWLVAKPGIQYLEEDDFIPLVTDVVESHPGLTFLQDAPEFHSRYIQTVISRIFYTVNRSWSGRITVAELRRSNLLQTIKLLEEEEDINQITDFFSYEHFYVIYCKFWELDKDHDLFISREDMVRHNEHAISSKMIDRIFSGAVTRNLKDGKFMSYKDFVWFLISEEDKRQPTAIEYWFRCMDLNGDGVVSMYEMEYFYREQVEKMEQLGIETLPFEDTLCQMLDMIKPRMEGTVSLRDLKACKLTPIFFDTFFNLDKYLEHEQKDPFANQRDLDSDEPEPSDWEKYAAEEYELLVAEEGVNEEIVYEDDFEPDEDATTPTTPTKNMIDNSTGQSKQSRQSRPKAPSPEEDIYDFSAKDLGY